MVKLGAAKETALFGKDIHAVVDDVVKSILAIKDVFNKENAGVNSVEKVLPSLEDVFVCLIEDYNEKNK